MTMKTLFQNAKNAVHSTKAKVAAGSFMAVGMIGSAQAQEAGTTASAVFDQITAEATEMGGYALGAVAVITGSLIGIKLLKKFANRAS